MAKKSGSKAATASATKTKTKRRKPAAGQRTKASSKRTSSGSAKARSKRPSAKKPEQPQGAADVVIKLLESPLVVDLIAVGATAALAAIAESRFGRRSDSAPGSTSAAKAAGKAAAAAMGRRIATEVEEILKASKGTTGGAKA